MTAVEAHSVDDQRDPNARLPRVVAIEAYLQETLGGPVVFLGRAPGNSHDGWIFARSVEPRQKVLVRLDPDEGPFLSYDGPQEAALIGQVGDSGVPVPRVLAIGDRDLCGAPFLVLEWIEGDVLNPRVVASDPVERRTVLATELVRTLALIHAVPVAELAGPGRAFPEETDGRLATYLAEFDQALAGLVAVRPVVLTYVRVWLEQHAANHEGQTSLVHGDFRLGNLVWRDSTIVGVLDWETARMGHPLFDVAWACMGATHDTGSVMGLVARREFVQMYADTVGREISDAELTFWQIAAAWVRGCTEARLLDISIMSHAPSERDARDLSWEFGSYRTEQELLHLIDTYEAAKR